MTTPPSSDRDIGQTCARGEWANSERAATRGTRLADDAATGRVSARFLPRPAGNDLRSGQRGGAARVLSRHLAEPITLSTTASIVSGCRSAPRSTFGHGLLRSQPEIDIRRPPERDVPFER